MIKSEEKVKFGLRVSMIEGCFAQIHINLSGGIFLTISRDTGITDQLWLSGWNFSQSTSSFLILVG